MAEVTFDWVTVGDPENASHQKLELGPDRFGSVAYTFRISKHEVTNNQYAEFLNNVAASDPNALFNSAVRITQSGVDGSFTYTAFS